MRQWKNGVLLYTLLVTLILGCNNSSNDTDTFDPTNMTQNNGLPTDVNGDWSGSWTSTKDKRLDGRFTTKITQDNNTLSGTISVYIINMEDAPLTGKIEGNKITFGDIDGIVSFSGTIANDDTASGNYRIVQVANDTGNWYAYNVRELKEVSQIRIMDYGRSLSNDKTSFYVGSSQSINKFNSFGEIIERFIYNETTHDEYWEEECPECSFISGPLRNFDSLTFDGTSIWAFDDENYEICKIENTGNVIATFPPPSGEKLNSAGPMKIALAALGDSIWVLDRATIKIYEMTKDWTIIKNFEYPTRERLLDEDAEHYGGFPGGLGADATHLWYTDYSEQLIYKINPSTGKAIRRYEGIPDTYGFGMVGEIAWDGSALWMNISGDTIYQLSE